MKMVKNTMTRMIEKIESLIPEASSQSEYFYLLGAKEVLSILRYLPQLQAQRIELCRNVTPSDVQTELKGGAE